MEYFTKVRIYYLDPKGVEKIAPAETVVTDMADDVAEKHMANGHLREATKGEIAEFAPALVEKPRRAASKGKVDPSTDETKGKSDDLA
jgi:hypothetical protein